MKIKTLHMLIGLTCFLWLSGCAVQKYKPPQIMPDDTRDIPEPEARDTTLAQDIFESEVVFPTARIFDFSRHLRSLSGNRRESMNVDAYGEVADSSWFTNRHAQKPMPLDEIARGPDRGTGPETEGPWRIFSAKVEGFSPGFNIIDARGARYVIKFDPFGFRELSSAAEVISTKIFYAAGYNVPENYIVYFDPDILKMDKECLLEDEKGVKCVMTVYDYDKIMDNIERMPDGRVRAVASKFLRGKSLGGFTFSGTRKDDPNDIVPHQHRRELRGLYVMCAWLKHFDIKDANTLDMYIEDNGRKYIKHHLLDFGSTLGSTTQGPMEPYKGQESDFDFGRAAINFLSLGVVIRGWEKAEDIEIPSIGRIEAETFSPDDTKMNYNVPAFTFRTRLDGYWGAKLVMSFSDEQLEYIVREGQYSDPRGETILLEVLKARRDKTGRFWFSKVNCLDHFQIDDLSDGTQKLLFTDLGVAGKLWTEKETRYRYQFKINNVLIKENEEIRDNTVIPLDKLDYFLKDSNKFRTEISADYQWEITLNISRDRGTSWEKGIKVYLQRNPSSGKFSLLGIKR